jgi:hypothetical protein
MAKSRKAERKSRKSERKDRKERKTRKQEGGKKKLSPWIKSVMELKKKNPKMEFGAVLKMASKMKKEGKL